MNPDESPFEMPEMEWDKIQTEPTRDYLIEYLVFALALMFAIGFLFGMYVT